MKSYSITFFCVFFFFLSIFSQQNENSWMHNKYTDIPEDTDDIIYDTLVIHDTVFVSDIDGFLKQYHCNLGSFAKKYSSSKRMVDSINNLSEERLYYNYFLPQDKKRKLSTRYMVKTFRLTRDVLKREDTEVNDYIGSDKLVRKEILFTCEGSDETDHFLRNPIAIAQVISEIFTTMQQFEGSDSTRIRGLNLYFPDYDFRDKRALVQFVKSVRITMDASHSFKIPEMRLNVTFLTPRGVSDLDKGFLYALIQEAAEVICIRQNTIDSCYVDGSSITSAKDINVSLLDQIQSHYYIARYYTGSLDIMKANLSNFPVSVLNTYLAVDYIENTWEIYCLLFVLTILIIIILVILYYTCLPVTTFFNKYIESIVLVIIVMALELIVLAITAFQHMCQDDDFSQLRNHPLIVFCLPFVFIFVIPLLKGISKKRKIP